MEASGREDKSGSLKDEHVGRLLKGQRKGVPRPG